MKKMLTVGEVAKLLGVHTNTVRHWASIGQLRCYRVGQRKDRRFDIEDVESLRVIEGCRHETVEPVGHRLRCVKCNRVFLAKSWFAMQLRGTAPSIERG